MACCRRECLCPTEEDAKRCGYFQPEQHPVEKDQNVPSRDPVNSPAHYKASGMEAIDVIEAFAPGNYHRGNALKYLLRAGKKGPAQTDLLKAIWYIRREIDRLDVPAR